MSLKDVEPAIRVFFAKIFRTIVGSTIFGAGSCGLVDGESREVLSSSPSLTTNFGTSHLV